MNLEQMRPLEPKTASDRLETATIVDIAVQASQQPDAEQRGIKRKELEMSQELRMPSLKKIKLMPLPRSVTVTVPDDLASLKTKVALARSISELDSALSFAGYTRKSVHTQSYASGTQESSGSQRATSKDPEIITSKSPPRTRELLPTIEGTQIARRAPVVFFSQKGARFDVSLTSFGGFRIDPRGSMLPNRGFVPTLIARELYTLVVRPLEILDNPEDIRSVELTAKMLGGTSGTDFAVDVLGEARGTSDVHGSRSGALCMNVRFERNDEVSASRVFHLELYVLAQARGGEVRVPSAYTLTSQPVCLLGPNQ